MTGKERNIQRLSHMHRCKRKNSPPNGRTGYAPVAILSRMIRITLFVSLPGPR